MNCPRPRRPGNLVAVLALGLLLATPTLAQESASYRLEEHALNAGGHPADGVTPASASFRVSLDALGQGVLGRELTSASYILDGGFVSAYPPPGEVSGLLLTDEQTLIWDPERSVGHYNLYRDRLSALADLSYGQCEQWGLTATTATDSDVPSPAGDGYFYLVTAANRLREEGTKGWDSSQAERSGPGACP
jgi:hypothetical protein